MYGVLATKNQLLRLLQPAIAEDVTLHKEAGNTQKQDLFDKATVAASSLEKAIAATPEGPAASARYCCDVLKVQMDAVRELSDSAELTTTKKLWPYASYQDILFGHHTENLQEY